MLQSHTTDQNANEFDQEMLQSQTTDQNANEYDQGMLQSHTTDQNTSENDQEMLITYHRPKQGTTRKRRSKNTIEVKQLALPSSAR